MYLIATQGNMIKASLVTTSHSQATALFKKVVVMEVVPKSAGAQDLEKEAPSQHDLLCLI